MARIRHIAIQTQDEEATKDFYVKNFGLEVVQKLQNERISGYFLTDGHIGAGGARAGHGNVEVRYIGPDNVNFDVSETGWVGTPSNKALHR